MIAKKRLLYTYSASKYLPYTVVFRVKRKRLEQPGENLIQLMLYPPLTKPGISCARMPHKGIKVQKLYLTRALHAELQYLRKVPNISLKIIPPSKRLTCVTHFSQRLNPALFF